MDHIIVRFMTVISYLSIVIDKIKKIMDNHTTSILITIMFAVC